MGSVGTVVWEASATHCLELVLSVICFTIWQ